MGAGGGGPAAFPDGASGRPWVPRCPSGVCRQVLPGLSIAFLAQGVRGSLLRPWASRSQGS